jgi:glutaminase
VVLALFLKSLATWSPKLNKKGNSELGMHALELLTTKTGMSVLVKKL